MLPSLARAVAGLTVLLCTAPVAAVTADYENGVLVLDESSFEAALKKFPVLMVEFYAPWCGHCKALQPTYDRAAKAVKKDNPNARLCKIDATSESGQKVAERYSVEGYPTLITFKDGEMFENYQGLREKDAIVGYVQAMSLPSFLRVPMTHYSTLLAAFKNVIRQTPLGKGGRKLLYTAFPGILASSFLLPLLLLCCCGGRRPEPAASSSTGQPATGDKQKGEKKEEKTAEEKKDE
mmetsp:Transcript_22583/g.41592  ORF Transcript_22583/g.41592 Transcript_22583/m.41592 type:complete len:236 (+) Transcript_22583:62-769(+)